MEENEQGNGTVEEQENVLPEIDDAALMEVHDGLFNEGKIFKTIEEAIGGVVEEEPIVDVTSVVKENETTTTPADDDKLDKYWKTLKGFYGDTFKVPDIIAKGVNDKGEPITPEQELVVLRDTLLHATMLGNTPEDDEFVREYIAASKQEGFDKKQFLNAKTQESNISDLPARDLLFVVNKQQYGISDNNKEGLSDEEIIEDIDRMSAAEQKKQALIIKQNIKNYEIQQRSYAKQKMDEEFNGFYTKLEEENSTMINEYLKKTQGLNNIDGIEFGQADITQYRKELPEFTKRKIVEVNGQKKAISEAETLLNNILNDEQKTLGLLPFLWMLKHDKVKGYSSSLKEAAKEKIEKTLDNVRQPDRGQGIGVSDEFDESAFYADTSLDYLKFNNK